MGKIFLQMNSAAVAFIDILIAAWEGLIYAAYNEAFSLIEFNTYCNTIKLPNSIQIWS